MTHSHCSHQVIRKRVCLYVYTYCGLSLGLSWAVLCGQRLDIVCLGFRALRLVVNVRWMIKFLQRKMWINWIRKHFGSSIVGGTKQVRYWIQLFTDIYTLIKHTYSIKIHIEHHIIMHWCICKGCSISFIPEFELKVWFLFQQTPEMALSYSLNLHIHLSPSSQSTSERSRRSVLDRSPGTSSAMWRTLLLGWTRLTASSSSTAPSFALNHSAWQVCNIKLV